jgi:predicted permease
MTGNQTEHVNGRGDSILTVFLRNLRYAGQRLIQSPVFTCTAILSLALGIGANTAIFSLVNAIILTEPPYEAPEELVNIYMRYPNSEYNPFSYPDYKDLRDGTSEVFSGVAASQIALVQIDREGGVETAAGEVVTGNYFPLLGIEALIGRTLLPEDDVAEGAHPVVMLEHGYWQRAYGGDPDVVGGEIRLGGRSYTIVGVTPKSYTGTFRGLAPAVVAPFMMVDELMPMGMNALENRGTHSAFLKARLEPGVMMARAQAVMDGVAAHLTETAPEDWDLDAGFMLVPTKGVIVVPPFDRFIHAAAWLLMMVVGLVLLMACTNLASFLLARGVDRRKEIALRLALGASRRSLMGQLLTETVLLGLAGGAAGVAVAVGLIRILLSADLPLPVPITLDLGLDGTVLGFNLLVSLLAGVVLGLAPAIQSTKPDVASTLKDESAGGGQRGKLVLRNVLVVAQVAVSLVLLVCAGLFLRSFREVQSVEPGFGREPAAIMTFLVPANRFSEDEGRVFTRTLMERFEQLPGVQAVGLIGNIHLNARGSVYNYSINVEGVEPPPERDFHVVDYSQVVPGFFDAAGIRIVRGRNFNDRDLPDSPPVAIINQVMARRFWPGQDPIGRTIQRADAEDLTVVGVATDAKIRSIGEDPRSFIYRPFSQAYNSFLTVLARTSIDPERTALDLLAAGREFDQELWVWEAKTMKQHLDVQALPARLSAVVLSAFSVLALALAGIGLYGIVSYSVSRRTREVGIRMSLGADRSRVIRTLMGSGMKLVILGSVIGLTIAFLAANVLTSLLFNVSAMDPTTFLLVPLVLAGTAMVAAYVPARRASRVDPAAALRAE